MQRPGVGRIILSLLHILAGVLSGMRGARRRVYAFRGGSKGSVILFGI